MGPLDKQAGHVWILHTSVHACDTPGRVPLGNLLLAPISQTPAHVGTCLSPRCTDTPEMPVLLTAAAVWRWGSCPAPLLRGGNPAGKKGGHCAFGQHQQSCLPGGDVTRGSRQAASQSPGNRDWGGLAAGGRERQRRTRCRSAALPWVPSGVAGRGAPVALHMAVGACPAVGTDLGHRSRSC